MNKVLPSATMLSLRFSINAKKKLKRFCKWDSKKKDVYVSQQNTVQRSLEAFYKQENFEQNK